MSHNLASDPRRGGRERSRPGRRRRLRPTLLALEDRRLLSTFTVTNTGDTGTGAGSLGAAAIAQANCDRRANETIAFDSDGLQHAADDHPDAAPSSS